MEKTVEENKMGTMPVGRLLFSMSAPMVASMLFQAFYNIVDSIFVARLSQDALNAVSLAFPLQTLIMAFCVGTGVGMCALLSKSLGEKDFDKADRAANTGIFLYVCTSLTFLVLGLLIAAPYYRLITDNQSIICFGTSYVKICIGCAFAICFQMSGERLLQATGRTDLAMIPQIVGACFNMVFDPVLIFGLLGFPRLEVKGAAIATVSGQIIAGILAYILNITKNKEIHIIPQKIRFHAETVKGIYKIGVPSIVMQAVGSFMNFALNNILIGFTEAATAAFGAYYKVQSFIFMPVFGMNSAIVPIVSYNFGAKYYDRVKKISKLGISAAVVIMAIGTLFFEVIPGPLLKMFSPTEEMLAVGKTAFRIISLSFPFAGFCIVSGSVCQALGRPNYSLITSLCRQLAVLLPASYLLSLTGKLDAVWFAFPLAEIVSLTLTVLFLRKTIKGLE